MKNSIKKIIREEVEIQGKELITEGALDKLQTVLGVAGVVFDPADALNAVISFFRQKWTEGVLNLVSMIPVVGSVVGTAVGGFVGSDVVGAGGGCGTRQPLVVSNTSDTGLEKWLPPSCSMTQKNAGKSRKRRCHVSLLAGIVAKKSLKR